MREEIERTRQEMSATVDAIADKVNVKAKASDAVAGAKHKVADRPVRDKVIVGGGAGLVLVLLIVRRRAKRASGDD